MKPITQILRISLGNDDKIVITCPQCQTRKRIRASALPKSRKPPKVRCSCGCKFRLILDSGEKKVAITCPQCQTRKHINVSILAKSPKPPKARCSCGCKFRLIPDNDDGATKVVKLSGLYTKLAISVAKEFGAFQMKQLSLTGLTFKALSHHTIQVGEFLRINFVLDNMEGSEIEKTVLVKRVDKQSIDVDFCHRQDLETALIRYLKAS